MSFKYIRCSDIVDVRDGTHDSPTYALEGYPLITSKNIKGNKIDFDNVNYISEEDFRKINMRSAVEKGDILMPMIGTVGNPVLVDIENEFAIKNVALFKLANNKEIESKYFYYLLISNIIVRQLESNKRGGTQAFVSLSNIRNLEIPYIHVNMQKQIVNTLDKAHALIDKRKAQMEDLDELVQSVFYDMFGDPISNPMNWDNGKIADIIVKTQYGTSSKADESNGEFEILRMNNITYKGDWDFSSIKFIDLDKKDHAKYLVYKGEVLFNRTNSKELVGKTAEYKRDKPMAYAGYLIKMIPNNRANGTFIATYMNTKYTKSTLFNMAKSIVGMANINAEELKNINIYIPPIELQYKFATIVENIQKQKQLLQQSLTQMENNFNAIMQKAFNGELFN